MNNPLLEDWDLPPFSRIKPEHAEPAIDTVLESNRQVLNQLLADLSQLSWENLIQPLDEAEDRLSRVWSPVRHLNSVMNSEAWRTAHDDCLAKITEYHTELGQNEALYHAIKNLSENTGQLEPAQRKALDDALMSFRLSGVDLPTDKKTRFKEIRQSLSKLSSKFEQNVLDATTAWTQLHHDTEKLKGLPENALAIAEDAAKQNDQQGWLLTLHAPCYIAVMTYADNRELRREMYTAYNTRASDQGPNAGHWDNSENIESIMQLRHEAASLLGFLNYAQRSLATKMAESEEQVLTFLNDLSAKALPPAREEFSELEKFAAEGLNGDALRPWDVAYYSEKLRKTRFDVSQEMLKPWFPVNKVISGLFEIVHRLYGVNITENSTVDVWHPDVRFYDIHDAEGLLRGRFYIDLYARKHKRGGAWMDECINRFRRDDGVQIPVAYLTCNQAPSSGDQPALLTHDEVLTFFHEFGHGLHHMLTRVDYPSIAGINGVEWDAVELPSQFMENWCWDDEALKLITGHYQTGEPLPTEMVNKLKAARNFHAAMQLVRQLEFSLFDFLLHRDYDPASGAKAQETLDQIRKQVAVVIPPEFVRFQHGFTHIFSGGYAAGYYGYKWAEVLSADAFSRFEENGIFDTATGREFMQCILERGGSEKAMDLFIKFRGRKPSIDPLLRHSGLAA